VIEDFTNKSLSAGNDVPQEEHQGLRILAKMIARSIIKNSQQTANSSGSSDPEKTE